MDGFSLSDFLTEGERSEFDALGVDIFGLLGSRGSDDDPEEEEEQQEEEEHVVKFKYSETKKRNLVDKFRTTYVNDYGRNDPYHIDEENSLANQVRNRIHAIYGNRTIVQYVEAMRDVLKVYQEMYDKSFHRLVLEFPDFVKLVVAGEIPGPVNHPLVRTNVPAEILLRYILNDKLDANEVKNFISTKENKGIPTMVVDLPNNTGWNDPVEFELMPVVIQKRMVQSWVSGKYKTIGLDDNEKRLLAGLVSLYDQVGIQDTAMFAFNEPLSHHRDIISIPNVRREIPHMIRLKDYTEENLEKARRGRLIRDIIDPPDDISSPEITIPDLIARMERKAADSNNPVSGLQWLHRYKLYAQGVTQVRVNKFGRETYVYRDNKKVHQGKISDAVRLVEEKAEAFKELTERMEERFTSLQYTDMVKEIRKEQDIIAKYGLSYFTEGD